MTPQMPTHRHERRTPPPSGPNNPSPTAELTALGARLCRLADSVEDLDTRCAELTDAVIRAGPTPNRRAHDPDPATARHRHSQRRRSPRLGFDGRRAGSHRVGRAGPLDRTNSRAVVRDHPRSATRLLGAPPSCCRRTRLAAPRPPSRPPTRRSPPPRTRMAHQMAPRRPPNCPRRHPPTRHPHLRARATPAQRSRTHATPPRPRATDPLSGGANVATHRPTRRTSPLAVLLRPSRACRPCDAPIGGGVVRSRHRSIRASDCGARIIDRRSRVKFV